MATYMERTYVYPEDSGSYARFSTFASRTRTRFGEAAARASGGKWRRAVPMKQLRGEYELFGPFVLRYHGHPKPTCLEVFMVNNK